MSPLLFALAFAAPAAGEAPWYDRPGCLEVAKLVYAPTFQKSTRALMKLEQSADPADKACAVYLRLVQAEMKISVWGLTEENIRYREFYLGQMIGLAKEHGKESQRYADLEMEAWTRRVRTYFEEGRRMDAVGAARRGFGLLQEREGPRTPTVDFVSGVYDCAVGHASTGMKMLFGMAGISGDLQKGHQAMMRLIEGDSVYRWEAMYVAHHWARESEDSPFGKAITWAERLHRLFPGNPQYRVDLAVARRRQGKPAAGLSVLQEELARIEEQPKRWSALTRVKLYVEAGLCAAASGRSKEAASYLAEARAEPKEPWRDYINDLIEQLEDAVG